jgi:hypothetical protein
MKLRVAQNTRNFFLAEEPLASQGLWSTKIISDTHQTQTMSFSLRFDVMRYPLSSYLTKDDVFCFLYLLLTVMIVAVNYEA